MKSVNGTLTQPDMLVFISDQHHAKYMGWAQHPFVRTPHLDRLAEEGTTMAAAYTAAPLCVPSRMAMLTGHLPEQTGVYTNAGTIGSDYTTFLHGVAAAGYETVLCGRMHFLGEDQRHGFTKRIMGELTPLFWGRYGKERTDLGPYVGTMANDSLRIIGGGNSPVLEYDRAVIQAALEYLEGDHDKPQCIVVGTYGPHHTYVAPPELYSYYKEKADIPASFRDSRLHPVVARQRNNQLTEDVVKKLRAAYFGMVETIDAQVGEVRAAWDRYLRRTERQGIFVYLSDHGEQAGEHGLIGKSTFYEGSVQIPMIFAGNGIAAGHAVTEPVSILDLGPTLCEAAGADTPPRQAGISLIPQLAGGEGSSKRTVVSEMLHVEAGQIIPGRMLRSSRWKFIAYAGNEEHDQLFDMHQDPREMHNAVTERSDIVEKFREELRRTWNIPRIMEGQKERFEHYVLLARWGRAVNVAESERWLVPEHAKELPVIE